MICVAEAGRMQGQRGRRDSCKRDGQLVDIMSTSWLRVKYCRIVVDKEWER